MQQAVPDQVVLPTHTSNTRQPGTLVGERPADASWHSHREDPQNSLLDEGRHWLLRAVIVVTEALGSLLAYTGVWKRGVDVASHP